MEVAWVGMSQDGSVFLGGLLFWVLATFIRVKCHTIGWARSVLARAWTTLLWQFVQRLLIAIPIVGLHIMSLMFNRVLSLLPRSNIIQWKCMQLRRKQLYASFCNMSTLGGISWAKPCHTHKGTWIWGKDSWHLPLRLRWPKLDDGHPQGYLKARARQRSCLKGYWQQVHNVHALIMHVIHGLQYILSLEEVFWHLVDKVGTCHLLIVWDNSRFSSTTKNVGGVGGSHNKAMYQN